MSVRVLTFLLPLSLVLGCDNGDSATDSGKDDTDTATDTDTGGDTDTATDTDTGGDTDTATDPGDDVILTPVGSFTAYQGQLTAVDIGWSWLYAEGWPIGGSVCDIAAPGVAASPGDCPTCDWSFNITASTSAPSGVGCEALDGLDGGKIQAWTENTSGFGWSDTYGAMTDVVWEYYFNDTYGTGAWEPVAYNYNGEVYVYGDSSGATFVGRKYLYEVY